MPTSNRFHAAREKLFSRKRKNICWAPFSSSGGPNGHKIKSCLMEIDITVDGAGHVLRTNTLLLYRGMRKRLSFVVIWQANAQDSGWTQTRFFYLGTERTAMNSLVLFLPVPQGRIGSRDVLTVQSDVAAQAYDTYTRSTYFYIKRQGSFMQAFVLLLLFLSIILYFIFFFFQVIGLKKLCRSSRWRPPSQASSNRRCASSPHTPTGSFPMNARSYPRTASARATCT